MLQEEFLERTWKHNIMPLVERNVLEGFQVYNVFRSKPNWLFCSWPWGPIKRWNILHDPKLWTTKLYLNKTKDLKFWFNDNIRHVKNVLFKIILETLLVATLNYWQTPNEWILCRGNCSIISSILQNENVTPIRFEIVLLLTFEIKVSRLDPSCWIHHTPTPLWMVKHN